MTRNKQLLLAIPIGLAVNAVFKYLLGPSPQTGALKSYQVLIGAAALCVVIGVIRRQRMLPEERAAQDAMQQANRRSVSKIRVILGIAPFLILLIVTSYYAKHKQVQPDAENAVQTAK